MSLTCRQVLPILCLTITQAAPWTTLARGGEPPVVSERASKIHAAGMLWDGHNDLPWRLRTEGDMALEKFDLSKRLDSGQTDIPRLREGGVKAQFWSVYIPSEHENPARTVTEQIDLVHRLIEKYPADLELALTADDVERIVKSGKIASLIGIEGGVAIENSLAQLRAFHQLGARYMTLTHNTTLDWADAANDAPRHDGLTPFGERVVKEMNRLGMLVDISHVSPATMADALRVSRAPVIASHSSAYALCPSPRNVPDDILALVKQNGGVIMVNFYSGFIVADAARKAKAIAEQFRTEYPDPAARKQAMETWYRTEGRSCRAARSRTWPTISTTSSRLPGSTTWGSAPTSTASRAGPRAWKTSPRTPGSPRSCCAAVIPSPTCTRFSAATFCGRSARPATWPGGCGKARRRRWMTSSRKKR